MGFQYLHCQKAAISTSNTGVEEAMNWLLNHMSDPGISHPLLFQRVCVSISFMFMDQKPIDTKKTVFPDIDEPIKKAQKTAPYIDPSKLDTLISFGFEEEIARKALQASVNPCSHIHNSSVFLKRDLVKLECTSYNNHQLILTGWRYWKSY